MLQRKIDLAVLYEVLETGEIKSHDETHLWVFKNVPSRQDNLICAAVVSESAVIVKTVMVNWILEDEA